jgi:hypothetical protein
MAIAIKTTIQIASIALAVRSCQRLRLSVVEGMAEGVEKFAGRCGVGVCFDRLGIVLADAVWVGDRRRREFYAGRDDRAMFFRPGRPGYLC